MEKILFLMLFISTSLYSMEKDSVAKEHKNKFAQISFYKSIGIDGKESASNNYNLSINLIAGELYAVNGLEIGTINIVRKNMNGIQITTLSNFSKFVYGIQVSGVINISEELNGIQIGGIFNSSYELNGIQIGLINFVDIVKNGGSIGLINFVDIVNNGGSIGLINFVRYDGYIAQEISLSDYGNTLFSFKSGQSHFYNIVSVRGGFINTQSFSVGYGLGSIFEINDNFAFQSEITTNYYYSEWNNNNFINSTELKFGLRYNMTNNIALLFTPSIYALFEDGENSSFGNIPPFYVNDNFSMGVNFNIGLEFH